MTRIGFSVVTALALFALAHAASPSLAPRDLSGCIEPFFAPGGQCDVAITKCVDSLIYSNDKGITCIRSFALCTSLQHDCFCGIRDSTPKGCFQAFAYHSPALPCAANWNRCLHYATHKDCEAGMRACGKAMNQCACL